MTFASDEAERQLLFVSFKESKTRNAQLEAELANSKSERGRMQDTSQKSQATLRERYTKLREENRKGVAETSKARAELEDSNVGFLLVPVMCKIADAILVIYRG